MRRWRQRIRGAIGIGFTWAAAWFFAAIGLGVVTGFDADVPFPLLFGLFGFIGGVIFSALLALTQGRRRFDQMSFRRFAGWGAVGGILLSSAFAKLASLSAGDVVVVVPIFALACAVCASGSLALARRAAARQELSHGWGDVGDAELPEHEAAKLRDDSE